jgi:hypothetical protein
MQICSATTRTSPTPPRWGCLYTANPQLQTAWFQPSSSISSEKLVVSKFVCFQTQLVYRTPRLVTTPSRRCWEPSGWCTWVGLCSSSIQFTLSARKRAWFQPLKLCKVMISWFQSLRFKWVKLYRATPGRHLVSHLHLTRTHRTGVLQEGRGVQALGHGVHQVSRVLPRVPRCGAGQRGGGARAVYEEQKHSGLFPAEGEGARGEVLRRRNKKIKNNFFLSFGRGDANPPSGRGVVSQYSFLLLFSCL